MRSKKKSHCRKKEKVVYLRLLFNPRPLGNATSIRPGSSRETGVTRFLRPARAVRPSLALLAVHLRSVLPPSFSTCLAVFTSAHGAPDAALPSATAEWPSSLGARCKGTDVTFDLFCSDQTLTRSCSQSAPVPAVTQQAPAANRRRSRRP